MFYLKIFIIYSIIGFTFESLVFKINNINKHSGVLTGPYSLVYGFGGVICTLLHNTYFSKINNIIVNYLLSYILFTITCTLIEFIIGHLIKIIYHLDSWDYSYKKYHFGKYICLEYAIYWGLLSFIFVNFFNNFIIEISNNISNNFTLITLSAITIDIILTFLKNKTLKH